MEVLDEGLNICLSCKSGEDKIQHIRIEVLGG